MGIIGAAVWATLCFVTLTALDGGNWRAQGWGLYALILVTYQAGLAGLGLAPLGLLIGWQVPRRLIGLRPWPVFLLGCYAGAAGGVLTAFGLASPVAMQFGWTATLDTLAFYILTLPLVIGIWTGLWAQRWRDRLPHGFVAGQLYWDGDCPFCIQWVGRFAFIARQGGFVLVPLQTEEARRDLGLREGELPSEMKLRLADGRLLGGVDAYIALAEAAGWTAPLGWLARLPGLNALAWRAYRWVAANRHCLAGQCTLPAKKGQRP